MNGLPETENAYMQLTARLDLDWVDMWTEQMETATAEGGDSLRIYNVDVETDAGNMSGMVAWLVKGLNIEKSQYVGCTQINGNVTHGPILGSAYKSTSQL